METTFVSIATNKADQSSSKSFQQMPVKLVISELRTTWAGRKLVHILSPLLTYFSLNTKWGIFHTAIVVGPWLLEWNTGEVVIPRKPVSSVSICTYKNKLIMIKSDCRHCCNKYEERPI